MTKDVTHAERARMNTLLSDMGAIQRVQRLHRDSQTAGVLNAVHDELRKEYDGLATRAREAAQERMSKTRAAKAAKAAER